MLNLLRQVSVDSTARYNKGWPVSQWQWSRPRGCQQGWAAVACAVSPQGLSLQSWSPSLWGLVTPGPSPASLRAALHLHGLVALALPCTRCFGHNVCGGVGVPQW